MEIKHLKFEELDSTQIWLKENIISHLDSNTLVSTRIQSKGTGRLGNSWDQLGRSLAFSFLAKPCEPLTLTSLEIGVQLANFLISKNQEMVLKWPNDLLIKEENNYKKVGGILSNYHNKNILIIGIGLNLEINKKFETKTSDFKFPPGQINIDLDDSEDFYHSLPKEFYHYLLNNRLEAKEVISKWNQLCAHKDSQVELRDNNNHYSGIFEGIGENGEALIKGPCGSKKFISGSLFF